ncbi:TPA: threonine--tRNA ligase [Candidatus Berkelbacteria bacterium]|uniref:Threonine--tRNA ligase n=1 Tax=Berkelbacteria bacterium GW2011_GWE1_39_12 TaxID=1618337 RepID=A0A0G4B4L9_9BACT|nr:MAG: threonyl-tRNA synthetase, threonyl-tRNA synthetase [Berkelbacteria bacterium GW2011_GWE1_39_12]HBO60351.1 threonine--tRNA ligase [Candidatus Berkelbacteria bacterium]
MSNEKNNRLDTLRHSCAHLLAAAILEMFPEAKLGVGPAVDNGFYYDFDLPRTLIPEDLPLIEEKMKALIKQDLPFEKEEVELNKAKELLEKAGQDYKLELVKDLPADEITFYKTGNFVDLCKGPHIKSTKELENAGWKLTKIAGAYWRGSEENKMLQRIYGACFQTKDELKQYEEMMIEAEKRDHRKLGKELDLFVFSDLVGPGLPLYTPKGTIIKDELQKKVEKICRQYGFQKVSCPSLAKIDLFKISGHADKFGDELFRVSSQGGLNFVLKPVQCPHQTQIYASKMRSYKDLPIRYMESDKQYRAEKTGEVGGLSRVFAITVEDGHSFCRIDQVKEEVMNMVKIIKDFYSEIGMWGNHKVSLSVRDYDHPEKYIGTKEDWDHAERMLEEISNEMELGAIKHEGEAALYGPKLDFMFKDAMGRDVQIPTVQLDFATPKRFELTYTDENNESISPVMVHRAILGSYERFIALLIEHFAGAFPFWLSPTQITIIPVAEVHNEYAKKVAKELAAFRVEIDSRNESLGKRIREAEIKKTPYTIVLGDKEENDQTITIRTRGTKELVTQKISELIEILDEKTC